MKIGTVIKSNEKGQIVVPKKLRDFLGINKDTFLNLVIRGKGIYLYPINEVMGEVDTENSYSKILKKTKGAWSENWTALQDKRRSIELKSSNKRKQTW